MVDMAHIAGLVAADQHPSPVPLADFVTSTTHKTLRGPRGGFVLCKQDWIAEDQSAVFPGMQGGPLMHVIAAKAVGFGEALQARLHALCRPGRSPTPRTLAYELQRPRLPPRLGRHRQPSAAGRRGRARRHRQAGRGSPRHGRHHRQQEQDPLRHPPAAGPVRHPHRHPGPDHARHEARRRCGKSRPGSAKCWGRLRTVRSL